MAKGKRRKQQRRAWEAVSVAVALLTARRSCPDVSQAEILGEFPPEPVIAALVTLANASLGGLCAKGHPVTSDAADAMLRTLGLAALEERARAIAWEEQRQPERRASSTRGAQPSSGPVRARGGDW